MKKIDKLTHKHTDTHRTPYERKSHKTYKFKMKMEMKYDFFFLFCTLAANVTGNPISRDSQDLKKFCSKNSFETVSQNFH